jgi:uncharacterized protein YndB with AHSA1/START domain
MKKLVVKKSIEINAPASKVWSIIASPNTWKRWMLVVPEVENDEPLGLRSNVLWKDESGKTYLTGTLSSFEPNKKFVLELQDISWTRKAKPIEVTYALTLSQKGGKTHVAFTLGDLSIDPEAQQWYDAYNESRELEIIKELSEKNE